MPWTVLFHEEFDLAVQQLAEDLQDELLGHAMLLQEFGPQLGRPSVDTLKGSKAREHEGATLRLGARSVASRLRIRSEAAGRSSLQLAIGADATKSGSTG